MRITVYIFCMVLTVVTIRAAPSLRRSRRSFKDEIDFGHGFGKRTNKGNLNSLLAKDSQEADRPLLSDSDLAKLLSESPELSAAIVRKFVDSNGDGYISKGELFPEGISL